MITSSERDQLKRLAHHVKPTVYVGKQGITETVVRTTEEVLLAHELMKVKFVDRKDEKRALVEELTQQTGSELVAILGHIATLYRPHPDPGKRRVNPSERRSPAGE